MVKSGHILERGFFGGIVIAAKIKNSNFALE